MKPKSPTSEQKAEKTADVDDAESKLTADQEDARRIIRAEMERRGIKYKELAKMLTKSGEPTTPRALISRITGGAFPFSFAIRVLRVLGVSQVDIRPLKDR